MEEHDYGFSRGLGPVRVVLERAGYDEDGERAGLRGVHDEAAQDQRGAGQRHHADALGPHRGRQDVPRRGAVFRPEQGRVGSPDQRARRHGALAVLPG